MWDLSLPVQSLKNKGGVCSLVAVRAVDLVASPSVGIDSNPSEWGFVEDRFQLY